MLIQDFTFPSNEPKTAFTLIWEKSIKDQYLRFFCDISSPIKNFLLIFFGRHCFKKKVMFYCMILLKLKYFQILMISNEILTYNCIRSYDKIHTTCRYDICILNESNLQQYCLWKNDKLHVYLRMNLSEWCFRQIVLLDTGTQNPLNLMYFGLHVLADQLIILEK